MVRRAAGGAYRVGGGLTLGALSLDGLADRGAIDPGWVDALRPAEADLVRMEAFLDAEEAAGRTVLPQRDLVLRAFRTPFAAVKVLLVGQDPYPNPGHPIGLAFAVERHVRPLPRSLVNVYRELESDVGVPPAPHGDLAAWTEQGVLLLNRCLTVRPGESAAHRNKGWERVTAQAIRALAARGGPLVAILWGRDAQGVGPLLGDVPRVESAHPSPLSARNGFFGSRPFSTVNALLAEQGAAPVDWRLDEPEE